MARTKMTRHELKAQDEITTTLQTFTEFVYARKKQLITGVIVVAVAAASILSWRIYSRNRNTNAQRQLSAAIAIFDDVNIKSDKERYEKALVEAQKTYEAYPSLPAGIIAQYYEALSREGLGDTAKAIEGLNRVIEQGDASLKGVAQFALAGIHKKHGDLEKALEVYKQLYDSGGYSKAAVTYELAALHEANNQADQAKDYYQKLVTEFPDSPFRQEADEALKRFGVTPTPPAQ